jgi:hypothetical protein
LKDSMNTQKLFLCHFFVKICQILHFMKNHEI